LGEVIIIYCDPPNYKYGESICNDCCLKYKTTGFEQKLKETYEKYYLPYNTSSQKEKEILH
jgi:hypothetical protein